MDIHEIRLNNFRELLRMVEDRLGSKRGVLREFAAITGISERQVSHLKCGRRNIGSATARNIERVFRIPDGWMDADHSGPNPSTESERLFVETALALYRRNPLAAHEAIARALKMEVECNSQQKTTRSLTLNAVAADSLNSRQE